MTCQDSPVNEGSPRSLMAAGGPDQRRLSVLPAPTLDPNPLRAKGMHKGCGAFWVSATGSCSHSMGRWLSEGAT